MLFDLVGSAILTVHLPIDATVVLFIKRRAQLIVVERPEVLLCFCAIREWFVLGQITKLVMPVNHLGLVLVHVKRRQGYEKIAQAEVVHDLHFTCGLDVLSRLVEPSSQLLLLYVCNSRLVQYGILDE